MATATKKRKATSAVLLEDTCYSSPSKVDREAGVIRGVKICGLDSRNAVPAEITGEKNRVAGYTYSKSARSQMAQLCEGMGVNIDHPSRDKPMASRSFRDRFGKLQNVVDKADGVYGDLHYLKSHPLAESIVEAAERMPEQFGLSPVAFTDMAKNGRGYVVESVKQVRSVDIVQKPATNVSLFEDEEERMASKLKFKDVFKEKPDVLALLEDMEPGISDQPVEGEAGDSDEAIKGAFRTAIVAAFDDDSLDMKATISRIREIIKAYYKLIEEPEPEEPAETEPEETEETEDTVPDDKPTAEDLQEEIKIRDMLWKRGIEPTKAKIAALMVLEEEDDRTELLESFVGKKEAKPKKTPRSGFVQEDEEETEAPKDGKRRSFVDAVTSPTRGYRPTHY